MLDEFEAYRTFFHWDRVKKYEYIKSLNPEQAMRLKYTWAAWARDNQLAPQGKWSTWVVKAGRGWGKALDLKTPVLTANRGWTSMEYVQVGDVLYDERGMQTKVTYVSPVMVDHTCYEVIFDSGDSIIADADHEWYVETTWRGRGVFTTEQLWEMKYRVFPSESYLIQGPRTIGMYVYSDQFTYHHISCIRRIVSRPVRCLQVDSPSHLFLAGASCIPTHNTRVGSEWVNEKANEYPGCHIALVGRTVADVRDVMVSGRSGILSCSPPWNMPTYFPSKRQVVWPNGTIATTYSSDTPDQLRGPQHSFAWCDERCFTGETLIRTENGLLPIKDIKPGNKVQTREGLKVVKHAGITNNDAIVYDLLTSDGRVLTGTANHPIWVEKDGFRPLHSLLPGNILMVWDQLNSTSSGTGVNGGSTMGTIATEKESCYTEPSTHLYMVQSQKEWTYTTKTKTKSITTSPILKCFQSQHIKNTTIALGSKVGRHGILRQEDTILKSSGRTKNHAALPVCSVGKSFLQQRLWQNFVMQTVERPIDEKTRLLPLQQVVNTAGKTFWSTKKACAIAPMNVAMRQNVEMPNPAQSVEKNFGHVTPTPFVAQEHVGLCTKTETRAQEKESVNTATNSLQSISHHSKPSFAPDNVVICTGIKNKPVTVLKVEKRLEKMAVYNLEVEDCHEYFANDILVHNCAWLHDDTYDQLMFGLRIEPAPGIIPQCVVTTTPRNTKAIVELLKEPGTIVTNGNTYENKDNLSERFIREIERKYAGTRLGAQEIYGDIISDIEGALWKREWIDATRVRETPALKRIIVAIDPPATSKETSDDPAEAGIVVAGIDFQNKAYVIADVSMIGTPDEWATKALQAYEHYQADLVVGEINNGGDMVEAIIRAVAYRSNMRHVPFEAVRATRGKQLRAEPISVMYERGYVHHIGVFPDLEWQMTNWVPGERSPDRLDALVWALTKLMIGNFMIGGMIIPEIDQKDIGLGWF